MSEKHDSDPPKHRGGALAVYGRIADPVTAVEKLGQFYHQSGMLGVKTPGAGAVLALSCMCDGITPLEFKRTYHIMHDGNVSMRADAMLAEFRSLGGKYKILSRTPERAEIELSYEGNTEKFSITLDDAKAERYYWSKDGKTPKDNWSTPRSVMQMLWARVVSDGIRVICPEAVAGRYTPEEIATDGEAYDVAYAPVALNPEETPATTPTPEPEQGNPTEPAEEPCTTDQLQAIVKWGEALGQTKKEIVDALANAYGIQKPQELSVAQARDAIEKMRAVYEKKSQSSQVD